MREVQTSPASMLASIELNNILPLERPPEVVPERIHPKAYKDKGLPLLDHRPFFLKTPILVVTIFINLIWIVWLAIVYTSTSITGRDFILGGLFSGYVATVTKFLISAQVMAIGKIMPYRNMVTGTKTNVQNTIDSDYWPYEWPFVRLRAIRNGDYFFQLVDFIAFLFTSAVVQFESNILSQNEDLSYSPHRGVIIIVLICHGMVAVTTIGILFWLQGKETGLLADPGCLSLYLTLLDKNDLRKDFRGIEAEDRRWKVRQRLINNQYIIGYWPKGKLAVYGIRTKRWPKSANTPPPSEVEPPKSRTISKYPEFHYMPWFLETFWITVYASILAAGLAVIATLVIHDNIITYGFNPHASTAVTPFAQISLAAFVWSFFPSFAAELFCMLVQSIDIFYRLVQPYADLKRKDQNPEAILKAFEINYTNDLPVIVSIRSLCNGHYKVALISIFSLSASLLPAWAANMFYIQDD
jgi:hypothetical protein